jgi:hypothetical protein
MTSRAGRAVATTHASARRSVGESGRPALVIDGSHPAPRAAGEEVPLRFQLRTPVDRAGTPRAGVRSAAADAA